MPNLPLNALHVLSGGEEAVGTKVCILKHVGGNYAHIHVHVYVVISIPAPHICTYVHVVVLAVDLATVNFTPQLGV